MYNSNMKKGKYEMDTLIIKTGKKYSFIEIDAIKWIESEQKYLKIYVKNNYYILKMNLKEILKYLDNEKFIRISHFRIININKIKEIIDSDKSDNFIVKLKDNSILNWTQKYRDNFPKFPVLQ